MTDLKLHRQSDKQETPRTDALRSKAGVSSMHFMLDEVLASHEQLERELAEEKARVERMMDAEQERLLLASEDEIRKEILADGRDPDEYLKAMDTVMKVTGENAILRHDLQKALANHSADLSARGDNPAADFAAQLAARRSYEALHWAATWVEESGHYNEAVRSFAKNMAMTIRAEADSRCEYVGKKK